MSAVLAQLLTHPTGWSNGKSLVRDTQRDVAQSGSAPEWGSGGRGFKSRRPDYLQSWCPFGGPFLPGLRPDLTELALLAHHREERFVIGLLIALEEGFRILPATGRSNVFQRMGLSLGGPLPAVGMP